MCGFKTPLARTEKSIPVPAHGKIKVIPAFDIGLIPLPHGNPASASVYSLEVVPVYIRCVHIYIA